MSQLPSDIAAGGVHSMSYLDLTGGDQIVHVIESFLHCCANGHQAVVPQDEHLKDKNTINKKHILLSSMSFRSSRFSSFYNYTIQIVIFTTAKVPFISF